jgi:hypothetical protein
MTAAGLARMNTDDIARPTAATKLLQRILVETRTLGGLFPCGKNLGFSEQLCAPPEKLAKKTSFYKCALRISSSDLPIRENPWPEVPSSCRLPDGPCAHARQNSWLPEKPSQVIMLE